MINTGAQGPDKPCALPWKRSYMTNVLSIEERQVRDSEFVDDFINNGGNATQAAKTVGVSDGSASTVGHRMKNRLINNYRSGPEKKP